MGSQDLIKSLGEPYINYKKRVPYAYAIFQKDR